MKKAPESVSGRPNSAETYKPSGMRRCDMNGNNKQIFIVISQTGTVLSRILKRITGAEYNHASLSLSPDLKKMYSFGRRHPYNPFRLSISGQSLPHQIPTLAGRKPGTRRQGSTSDSGKTDSLSTPNTTTVSAPM